MSRGLRPGTMIARHRGVRVRVPGERKAQVEAACRIKCLVVPDADVAGLRTLATEPGAVWPW